MKKVNNYIMISMFLLLIYGVMFANLKVEQRTFSPVENRALQTMPQISLANIKSGDLFKSFDVYVADQFFKRDIFVKLYVKFQLDVLNKEKINEVVIGEDRTLLQYYPNCDIQKKKIEDKDKVVLNANKINDLYNLLKKKNIKFYMETIPEQHGYNFDKYPYYLNNNKEVLLNNEMIFENTIDKEINYIKMRQIFENSGQDNLYYKNDHHWNMNGAYMGYSEVMKKIEEDFLNVSLPINEDKINKQYHNEFFGSYGRQLQYLYNSYDKTELWTIKDYPVYEKYDDDKRDDEFFKKQYINSYSVYMGGDVGKTYIDTNRKELPKALIVGDSFTNATEYLFSYHFDKTMILDLRVKKQNLYDIVEEYKPDLVIFMVNTEYFSKEDSYPIFNFK